MDNKKILTAFNNHFFEFVDDIINVFKNDNELLTARSMLLKLRKSNPKIIMKIYIQYVLDKYKNEIMNGDIDYFLNKDYTEDLNNHLDAGAMNKALQAIDNLRTPMRDTTDENKSKCLQYLKNLNKLTQIYSSM